MQYFETRSDNQGQKSLDRLSLFSFIHHTIWINIENGERGKIIGNYASVVQHFWP